jgi:hypothetical protein
LGLFGYPTQYGRKAEILIAGIIRQIAQGHLAQDFVALRLHHDELVSSPTLTSNLPRLPSQDGSAFVGKYPTKQSGICDDRSLHLITRSFFPQWPTGPTRIVHSPE